MARSAWHEVQVAQFIRLLEDIPVSDLNVLCIKVFVVYAELSRSECRLAEFAIH